MDNWSRGWRKLVEWDNINKVYLYLILIRLNYLIIYKMNIIGVK